MSTASPLSSEGAKTHQAELVAALAEMHRMVVGQDKMLERLLLAILLDSHVLLEGVPGLAKTTAVKALAQVLSVQFKRIQFTPDLLPSDVIGTQVYDPREQTFFVKKGPLFTHILLADEINRAPAKVQSALLEAMQERQVTIGEETFRLERPFTVLATQNPIEQEGTYPLPEAQMDRFIFKVHLDYPSFDDELQIVGDMHRRGEASLEPLLNAHTILELQNRVREIHIDPRIDRYIVTLVHATRFPAEHKLAKLASWIQLGASPRASLSLHAAAQGLALLRGRTFVTPHDIKELAPDVLRHRILLTYEAEAEGRKPDDIISEILNHIEVP